MDSLIEAVNGLIAQSGLEWVAMLLGLAYLVFIIKQNVLAWPCAFCSTAIYTIVFWDAALLMEAALNMYYLFMALYGFWCWTRSRHHMESNIPIVRWSLLKHGIALGCILLLSAISGFFLDKETHAAWPYVDSFTTWGAVLTTYMVAKKVYENWYYWLVIDSLALLLYIERALYPTALLMCVYLVMIVIGMRRWHEQLRTQ